MNPAQIQIAMAAWQKARSLLEAGMLREADVHFRKALQIMPRVPDLLADYGRLAEQLGDWRAAENIWRAAQQAAPDRSYGDHLGLALLQQNRNEDALPVLEQHQKKFANDIDSLLNLAVAYSRLQRDEDAIRILRQATKLRPDRLMSWESLITLLINNSLREDADAALEKARKLFPDDSELRYMEMDHRLKSRDFAGGFDIFDRRWKTRFAGAEGTDFRLPQNKLWDGRDFTGKLLVRAEQGIGDELLYSSLLPDLQQRHADTVVDCDPRLLPLFARSFPAMVFVPRKTPNDDPRIAGFASQCLFGDLPRLFRRHVGDFPKQAGWIRADEVRRQTLAGEYGRLFPGLLRVGISWRSKHPTSGDAKSLTLDRLQPLLATPGVQFFNLQYGDTAAEIEAFAARTGIRIHSEPTVDPTQDLDGLAAQIAALDLVISTSNSTVHLAGALGTPVWIMLHRDQGLPWYWAYEGETVPWYPNTRLIRCRRRGEWEPVIAEATERLQQHAQSAR